MTNEEFQKLVLERLNNLQENVGSLQAAVTNLTEQTKENTDLIHALIHRTDILDAKIEGLKLSTVSKEALERIETKIDILTHRVAAQDGEIKLLKLAK